MKTPLIFIFSFCFFYSSAQTIKTDSTMLDDVVVKGYYNTQSLLRSVATVSLLDSNQIKNQSNSSLVGLMNTVAGVRMEERSPGSYRLSLRGSLLRAPFGIRNIKIYFDDFPLTDAGGNTYLNALDFSALASIEIYKGPEANIYGANTGGAVLIKSGALNKDQSIASVSGGSFGLFHQTASLTKHFKNYQFNLNEGYQRSDGYRDNSAMNRKFIQSSQQFNYNTRGYLKLLAFYSDLVYQTPGGLTALQLAENPKAARPATPTLPSATAQKAAIYNKTLFAGISNVYQLGNDFKHVISLYGTYTDFKNPFITNYERRYENTLGLRTFIAYNHRLDLVKFDAQLGLEGAATKTQIKNFNNNGGQVGLLQAFDDITAQQNFGFLKLNFDFDNRLLIELASSLNYYRYRYESFYPILVEQMKKKFNVALMPKVAASYLVTKNLSIRASISKGYSPPTIAEVRASDNVINTNLQAELGWNYEVGVRYKAKNNRIYFNANAFYFGLKDAIVRRLNVNDAEYFINAGSTTQKGLELEGIFWVLKDQTGLVKGLSLTTAYTLSKFKFKDFTVGKSNFSGNKLTGVPEHVIVNGLAFDLKQGFYTFVQHNHTAAIAVNDANTVMAKKYDLVDLKLGKRNLKLGRGNFEVFFGINNLLNENYSLGNDLNAVGGRYFNPAATRNFYVGLGLKVGG